MWHGRKASGGRANVDRCGRGPLKNQEETVLIGRGVVAKVRVIQDHGGHAGVVDAAAVGSAGVAANACDAGLIKKLVAQLDSNQYAIREAADKRLTQEVSYLGKFARPMLLELAKGKLSSEAGRRVQQLIAQLPDGAKPEAKLAAPLLLGAKGEGGREDRQWPGGNNHRWEAPQARELGVRTGEQCGSKERERPSGDKNQWSADQLC
jgi:hypothetical protein